jgi:hypothetical protein
VLRDVFKCGSYENRASAGKWTSRKKDELLLSDVATTSFVYILGSLCIQWLEVLSGTVAQMTIS